MMLTLNFSRAELSCRCCSKIPTDNAVITFQQWEDFLADLQRLRLVYGRAMHISSGYRCPIHNASVGGSERSHHLTMAVDVVVAGEDAYRLVKCAQDMGWNGIGVSQKGEWGRRFIHLDRRPEPMIWSY